MSSTIVELIKPKEEKKDIDITVRISAKYLENTLQEYADELDRLQTETKITSVGAMLVELAKIIRKL